MSVFSSSRRYNPSRRHDGGDDAMTPPLSLPLAAGAANVSSVLVGVCDQAGSDFHHGCPAPGDVVAVSHSALGMSAVQLTAHVADTKGVVAVVLRNVGLEPLDVPAGTLRVVVYKFE